MTPWDRNFITLKAFILVKLYSYNQSYFQVQRKKLTLWQYSSSLKVSYKKFKISVTDFFEQKRKRRKTKRQERKKPNLTNRLEKFSTWYLVPK